MTERLEERYDLNVYPGLPPSGDQCLPRVEGGMACNDFNKQKKTTNSELTPVAWGGGLSPTKLCPCTMQTCMKKKNKNCGCRHAWRAAKEMRCELMMLGS